MEMTHFCDANEITGLSDEADDLPSIVQDHILDSATLAQYSARVWLPGVYSERDDDLRDALVESLGQPVPSGYMSEECGWEVTEYVTIEPI
jgi:hypothetical protein